VYSDFLQKAKNSMTAESAEKLTEELTEELREALRGEYFNVDYDEDRSERDYPWIVFDLDGTEYGINSKNVLSIEILSEVTPIVDAQSYCPGITCSRGDMIELLDLRALFGLGDYISAKSEEKDARYMMIITETGTVKRGMIVDNIVAVEYISQFEPNILGKSDGALKSKYINRIAKRDKMNHPVLIVSADNLSAF